MSATFRKKRAARQKRFFQEGQRRIKKRLANTPGLERPIPMMTATNIHYEQANRVRGLSAGGIGAILLLAQKIELDKEIDRTLHLLKRHLPYHESDHVLNIAFNIVAGGKRIEHLRTYPRPDDRRGLLPPLLFRGRSPHPDERHQ